MTSMSFFICVYTHACLLRAEKEHGNGRQLEILEKIDLRGSAGYAHQNEQSRHQIGTTARRRPWARSTRL
jgi:hypothetical protein